MSDILTAMEQTIQKVLMLFLDEKGKECWQVSLDKNLHDSHGFDPEIREIEREIVELFAVKSWVHWTAPNSFYDYDVFLYAKKFQNLKK